MSFLPEVFSFATPGLELNDILIGLRYGTLLTIDYSLLTIHYCANEICIFNPALVDVIGAVVAIFGFVIVWSK